MTGEERFWQIASELQEEDDRIEVGRIMSSKCLRVGKEFLALYDDKRDGVVIKLPKERVQELIAAGTGESFAPAGRVFKEWVLVDEAGRRRWRSLLLAGVEFVGS
jgi:hypothetical protein